MLNCSDLIAYADVQMFRRFFLIKKKNVLFDPFLWIRSEISTVLNYVVLQHK